MSETASLRDHYLELIDKIVETTLKGQIRSKEQVYQMLLRDVSPGTGEIFERCLAERLSSTQDEVDRQIKVATASRRLRALTTIQGEWQRWQKESTVSGAIATAVQQIIIAQPNHRLTSLLRAIDPNRAEVLNLNELRQLSEALKQEATASDDPDQRGELQQLALGLDRGRESWQRLEGYLVSWIYDQGQGPLGFSGAPEQRGPWALWAKQVSSPFPQALFNTLALNQSLVAFSAKQYGLSLGAWVELAVILQCLQRGLVAWFDQRIYDAKIGTKLSISTYLTFAVIWSQLASGFNQTVSGQRLANGCFQVTLQILRTFAQRDYFPLYGGIYASFAGNYLRDALEYLDEPLRRVEGTQEKARILTLLGASLGAQGQYERANVFLNQALEIARQAGDRPCEIAALNHLSRICVAQKNFGEAIAHSQRALIFARQAGERLGEANALANLGYSEVFQAQQLEQIEPETYESAISYLQQGLQLSERLEDRQSQALCLSSLGIAHVILDKPQEAIAYLEESLKAAQFSGDLYLQGLSLAYLAEAHYSLNNHGQAISTGCLGMYLLEQIGAKEWRQPAGLLTIVQGQIGVETFQTLLERHRAQIIAAIGVDGYDHIPQLLKRYNNE